MALRNVTAAAFVCAAASVLVPFAAFAQAPAPAPAPAPVAPVAPVVTEAPAAVPAPEDTIKVVNLPAGVIAQVNGEPVAEKEWVDTLKLVAGSRVLKVMILHKIVHQEAVKRGIKLSDDDFDVEYDKAINEMGGNEALLAQLQEEERTIEEYKETLRTDILLRKMVENDVKVTDEEVKTYFLEEYGRKADVQVIVTGTKPEAEQVIIRAKAGEDFGTLADEFSTDAYTKRNRAFLPGPLTDGFFPKPYGDIIITQPMAEEIFKLKPGEVSKVSYAGQQGFYVFRLRAFQPAKDVKFETVREPMTTAARNTAIYNAKGMYLRQLYEKSDIRMGIKQ